MPSIYVELKATINEFTAAMGEARAELDATQKKGESAFSGLGQFGTAAFAGLATGAIALGTEALHLADTFEVSHARLTASLEANGTSFDAWSGQINAADAAGQKLGFTNAEVQDGLARLETMVKNPVTALKDLSVAEDVARARGLDLTTASNLVGKASEGTYTALVKLGVVTKDQAKAFTSGAEAVDYLGHAFSGQAAGYADTFAGKMAVLKAQAENIGTAIGLWLIPKIEALGSAVSGVITWFEKHRVVVEVLAGVLATVLVPVLIATAVSMTAAFAASTMDALVTMAELVVNLAVDMTALGLATDAATGPIGLLAAGFALLSEKGSNWNDLTDSEKAWAEAFVNGLSGVTDKVGALRNEEDALMRQSDQLGAQLSKMSAGKAYGQVADEQKSVLDKAQLIGDALKKAQTQVVASNQAQVDLANATGDATTADQEAAAAKKSLAQAITDANKAITEQTKDTKDYYDAAVAADRADINWADKVDALKAALVKSHDSITLTNADTRAARGIVDDLVTATDTQVKAELASGDTADQMRSKIQGYVDKLDAAGRSAGLTTTQLNDLHTRMGLDSGSVNVQINMNAADAEALLAATKAQAIAALQAVQVASAGIIGGSYSLPATTPAPFRAAGGPVAAGQPYIVGEKGMELFIPDMSGTVIDASRTAAAMLGATGASYMSNVVAGEMKAAASASAAITADMVKRAKATMAAGALASGLGNIPGSVSDWVTTAIGLTGAPGSWLGALDVIAMHESGGNPSSINLWDTNAQAGHPSQGLFQTIPSTFASNMIAGHGNILNPVDNAAAAIEYILRRYGDVWHVPGIASLARGGPYVGYDNGGLLKPGLTMAWNGTGSPEQVIGPSGAGGGGLTVNLINNGGVIAGPGGIKGISDAVRVQLLQDLRGKVTTGIH